MKKYTEYGMYPTVGTEMWCPVCGKYFKSSDDTRYIRHNMYVCGWKCFRDPSKEVKEEPSENQLAEVRVKVAKVRTSNKNKTIVAKDILTNDKNTDKNEKSAKIAHKDSLKSAKIELF